MNPIETHQSIESLPKTIGLPANTSLEQSDSYKKGYFEIQDLGSQVITEICNAKKDEEWWDACAGAGGKSLSLIEKSAYVSASDIRVYKLKELQRRAHKAKQSITTFECDLNTSYNTEQYDGVLIDAPCSCSGTWRRRPSDRWKTTEKELSEILTLQNNIIESASKSVKAGGTLVYATCSVFTEENIDIVNQFLKKNTDFKLVPFINPIENVETDGTLQLWPQTHNSDGMFMAKFKRI